VPKLTPFYVLYHFVLTFMFIFLAVLYSRRIENIFLPSVQSLSSRHSKWFDRTHKTKSYRYSNIHFIPSTDLVRTQSKFNKNSSTDSLEAIPSRTCTTWVALSEVPDNLHPAAWTWTRISHHKEVGEIRQSVCIIADTTLGKGPNKVSNLRTILFQRIPF